MKIRIGILMKVDKKKLKEMILNGEDVSNVDTSEIIDMSYLFHGNKKFNQDISKWEVSNVINMKSMFDNSIFTGDISKWNTSNVVYMNSMFESSIFNGDISKWDVSNVRDMKLMFAGSCFSNDISNWNVENVINMRLMFYRSVFKKSLLKWKESIKCDIYYMLSECAYNGDKFNFKLRIKQKDLIYSKNYKFISKSIIREKDESK